MNELLSINDLHVSVQDKQILKGISLKVKKGEIHAIMGPNGSGKSTLSYVLAGHPKYAVNKGKIIFKEKDLVKLQPNERTNEGFFLTFQHPTEIPGVTLRNFLYNICKQRRKDLSPLQFKEQLQPYLELLGYNTSFLDRYLNVGFSGGEKKRTEILQLLMLQPSLAVLDEIDSGLDVDSLKIMAKAIASMQNKEFSAVLITHYPHILEFLTPNYVHILIDGKIVASGNMKLALDIKENGYEKWTK